MEIRHPIHPDHGRNLDTAGLRREFLVQDIMKPGALSLTYSHVDRALLGGAVPLATPIDLTVDTKTIGADYLLERRELGVINLGGPGTVRVDKKDFAMDRLVGLYVGKGSRTIEFASLDKDRPARFYFLSGVAHRELATKIVSRDMAKRIELGSLEQSNRRTIYQVIHPEVVQTCSLVMGFTCLEPGSVWNTMPCHTHERRMEVYLYFDLPEDAVVFHMMGEPHETRHLVVRNEEAVISPSWSIHSGVGSRNYSFVWGMLGENQTFTDMDAVGMETLR